MNGAMMFVAYYTIVHSSKIENEILTQCLFLASILFLVHNMNLLGIRPNNFSIMSGTEKVRDCC